MPITITIVRTPDEEPAPEPAWTVAELAEDLEYHPETVRRYVAAGLWPHTRWGRRIVFTAEQRRSILSSFIEPHDFPAHTHGGL